jgi:hypothetical protein
MRDGGDETRLSSTISTRKYASGRPASIASPSTIVRGFGPSSFS